MSFPKNSKFKKKISKKHPCNEQIICPTDNYIIRKLKIIIKPKFIQACNMINKFNKKITSDDTETENLVPVGDQFYKYLITFGALEHYSFNARNCDLKDDNCSIDVTYEVSKSANKAFHQCLVDFGSEIDIFPAPASEQPPTEINILDKLTNSNFQSIFKYLNLFELSILEQVCWRFFELIREHFSLLKVVDFSNLKPLRGSTIRILFIKISGQHLATLKYDGYQVLIDEPVLLLFKYMVRYAISVHTLEIKNFEYFYCPSFVKIFFNVVSLKLSGQLTDNIACYLWQAKNLTNLKLTDPMITGYCLTNLHNIKCLDVNYCAALKSEYLLEFFQNNTQLASLSIVGCKGLSKCIVKYIADCLPKLRKLQIDANMIDISSPLTNNQLNVLHIYADKKLNSGKYIDNFLIKLAKYATELEEFHVYEWSINCTSQNLLNNFSRLKKIHFDDSSKIDPNVFVNIAMKQVLTEISLTNCPILSNAHCICFFRYCPKLHYMNFRFCPLISNSVIREGITIISSQPERTEKVTFTIRGTGIKPSSFKENIFRLCTIRIID